MNNRTFTQDLLGVQNDLLRFAYKLGTVVKFRHYESIGRLSR